MHLIHRTRRTVAGPSLAVASLASCMLAACSPAQPPSGSVGSPAAGAVEIDRMACGSCHRIPGIQHADGRVGPPLERFASQKLIAGYLPNSPANLAHYLKNPKLVGAGNVMPDQGLTDRQIRDIVAFLYTRR